MCIAVGVAVDSARSLVYVAYDVLAKVDAFDGAPATPAFSSTLYTTGAGDFSCQVGAFQTGGHDYLLGLVLTDINRMQFTCVGLVLRAASCFGSTLCFSLTSSVWSSSYFDLGPSGGSSNGDPRKPMGCRCAASPARRTSRALAFCDALCLLGHPLISFLRAVSLACRLCGLPRPDLW